MRCVSLLVIAPLENFLSEHGNLGIYWLDLVLSRDDELNKVDDKNDGMRRANDEHELGSPALQIIKLWPHNSILASTFF